jgi:hypothetical protein
MGAVVAQAAGETRVRRALRCQREGSVLRGGARTWSSMLCLEGGGVCCCVSSALRLEFRRDTAVDPIDRVLNRLKLINNRGAQLSVLMATNRPFRCLPTSRPEGGEKRGMAMLARVTGGAPAGSHRPCPTGVCVWRRHAQVVAVVAAQSARSKRVPSVSATAGASRSSPVRPAPRTRARLQLRRRLAACCCVLRPKLLSGAVDGD